MNSFQFTADSNKLTIKNVKFVFNQIYSDFQSDLSHRRVLLALREKVKKVSNLHKHNTF